MGDMRGIFGVNLAWEGNFRVGVIKLFHGWTDGQARQMDMMKLIYLHQSGRAQGPGFKKEIHISLR